MQLGEIMTMDLETVDPNASLQEAARIMALLDVGVLPVITGDVIVGILTDRDITVRATAEGLDPTRTTVRHAMTDTLICGFTDQSVEEGARLMMDNQIRRLPILNRDRKLAGIVSLADLAVSGDGEDWASAVLRQVSEPTKALAQI